MVEVGVALPLPPRGVREKVTVGVREGEKEAEGVAAALPVALRVGVRVPVRDLVKVGETVTEAACEGVPLGEAAPPVGDTVSLAVGVARVVGDRLGVALTLALGVEEAALGVDAGEGDRERLPLGVPDSVAPPATLALTE